MWCLLPLINSAVSYFSFIVPKGTFTLHSIRYEMERFWAQNVNSKGHKASLNGINKILVILFMPRRKRIRSSNIISQSMFYIIIQNIKLKSILYLHILCIKINILVIYIVSCTIIISWTINNSQCKYCYYTKQIFWKFLQSSFSLKVS